ERAVSFAVNRGHNGVTDKDVEDALEKHSDYLVSFFGYELRDVSGISDKIFYAFIGHPARLTSSQIEEITVSERNGIAPDEAITLLMWYGFLGIPDSVGNPRFIYNFNYDMRRMEAERGRLGAGIQYIVNPAFVRGLQD